MSITDRLLFIVLASVASHALAAGKTPPEIAHYLKSQGPVIEHKIFRASEPREQIVLYFCVDENLKGGATEGGNNPANVHCDVALFNREAKWVFANRVFIGQGSIQEFTGGVVKGEAVTYAPEDPLCCPSKKSKVVLTTSGGKLVSAPQ